MSSIRKLKRRFYTEHTWDQLHNDQVRNRAISKMRERILHMREALATQARAARFAGTTLATFAALLDDDIAATLAIPAIIVGEPE